MIREIYTRDLDDPKYDGSLETRSPLESILAKVRMVLGTTQGEVLGTRELGCDIEQMVFSTKKNSMEIEKQLGEQFQKYINMSPNYTVTPKIQFGHHEDGYDYAVIDIYVNDTRIQKFMID